MTKTGNPEGRPPCFKSPQELQKKIDAYLKECKDNIEEIINDKGQVVKVKKPLIPSIAGLAYALDVDRQTIYNYQEKNQYFGIIKKARDFIYTQIEKKCLNTNGNIGGTIFIAKNYGYQDSQALIAPEQPLQIKIIKE